MPKQEKTAEQLFTMPRKGSMTIILSLLSWKALAQSKMGPTCNTCNSKPQLLETAALAVKT